MAVRYLRDARRFRSSGGRLSGFPALLALASVGLGVWGIVEGKVLLMIFAVLGTAVAVRDLRMQLSIPKDKRCKVPIRRHLNLCYEN